jgi:hypothetical protein
MMVKRKSNPLKQAWRSTYWAIGLFSAAALFGMFFSTRSLAEEDLETIPLTPPYVTERFGTPLFFPSHPGS